MKGLKDFTLLPKTLIKKDQPLEVNIYVHLPHNETVIQYRRAGDVLSADDMIFFEKIKTELILVPNTEMSKLHRMSSSALTTAVSAQSLRSNEVRDAAKITLYTSNHFSPTAQAIEELGGVVHNLISLFQSSPSVTAYKDALMYARTKTSDPLMLHQRQVSVVVVLMALAIGDFSMEDLSDLGTAGLLHDMGLKNGNQQVLKGHVAEFREFSTSEKLMYMKHIDDTIAEIKRERISITPGAFRSIELHHENWDGSGFRGYAGNKIYRPARVLRLADDFVSLVHAMKQKYSYDDVLAKLVEYGHAYDPDMLNKLKVGIEEEV